MTITEFKLDYQVTGDERKRLVKAISDYTQADSKYLGAPTFAYEVDYFTIDRNGVVSFDDRADSEEIEGLIEALAEQGFTAAANGTEAEDEPTAEAEDAEETTEAETVEEPAEAEATEEPAETEAAEEPTKAEDEGAAGLCIQLPRDGATEYAIDNIRKMVESKASLIRKALGADSLEITADEERISFPWFTSLPDPEMAKAAAAFVAKLTATAKAQKRVTATERTVDNEKYAFRCFLLRLGFIGADCKADRKILLRNLEGSSAFKSGQKGGSSNADAEQ